MADIITQVKDSSNISIPIGAEAQYVILDQNDGEAGAYTGNRENHKNLQDKIIQLNRSIRLDVYSGNASGENAISYGYNTLASGQASHAEGMYAQATATGAHAEGTRNDDNLATTANGIGSHAEGRGTTTNGKGAHAEGYTTSAQGDASHAEGYLALSEGIYSHAEGYTTHAKGKASHAEGYRTSAEGDYSHAEGYQTSAIAIYSHAEGFSTIAQGDFAHAEGNGSNANGFASHTEGYQTTAVGSFSHAEGYKCQTKNNFSHIEGENNYLGYGYWAHMEGYNNRQDINVTALGSYHDGSHIEGRDNYSEVPGIHIEGEGHSVAISLIEKELEVPENIGMGAPFTLRESSFTYNNIFYSFSAIIETTFPDKYLNIDAAIVSLNLTQGMIKDNVLMIKKPIYNYIILYMQDDVGLNGASYINYITLQKYYLKSNGLKQGAHIQGKYSKADNENYAHLIGGGDSDLNRKNIHTIDWDGNAMFAGDIEFKYVMTDSSLNQIISLSEKILELENRLKVLENA